MIAGSAGPALALAGAGLGEGDDLTIPEDPRPACQVGRRTGRQGASWSPAQVTSLVIGVWWTTSGIGAFFIDPNFATGHVHGRGQMFGVVTITANGWHVLFHLLPGLLGIAVATRPRASLAYTLGIGAMYIIAGSWGLRAGGSSLGVIAVDAPGDVVHMSEGVIALAAGILTLRNIRTVATGGPTS